ncbi:MerR family transcriptional regulator [Rhizobium sp. G187]|uniref:MerR family transcriptional regulator n=1 Tax=Rhizobium sp. G187 TaxID=3451352 RepID=UPI003EE7026B
MAVDRPDPDRSLLGLSEVLAIAGISKLVLHAWERRYGLAPAGRSDTGLRFYTRAQAEHLRLLKACCDAGYRIGTLISLSSDELMRIEEDHAAKLSLVTLLEAIQALDGEALQEALSARAASEGPDRFVRRTALPLLREVGLLWSIGSVTAAAEHLATFKIKRILGRMLDDCPPPLADAPRLIATTPEGQQHEVGALVAALMARMEGCNVLYLGPDLPVEDIAFAVRTRQADIVCLSALTGKRRVLESQLRDLLSALPPKTEIWLGGPAYSTMPSMDRLRVFADLDTFVTALRMAKKPAAQIG